MSCFPVTKKKNVSKQKKSTFGSRVQPKRKLRETFSSRRVNHTNIIFDPVSPNDDATTTTIVQLTQPTLVARRSSKVEKLPRIDQGVPPPIAPRKNVKALPELPNNIQDNQEKRFGTTLPSIEQNQSTLPKIKISSQGSNRSSTHHIPGLCGLSNIGNTCFMNSALQCLSNVPELTQWAKEQKLVSMQSRNIIQIYCSLIQAMWSGEYASINPQDIKESVSRSASIFAGYGQHDSHEFMNSLLNALETIDSTSIITNLFRIHTQSQVTCTKCNFLDVTDETTTFLALPLPDKTNRSREISLEDLLEDFCEEDDLDGSYYCHTCDNYTQARQKTSICSSLPRVLIVQFKRFPFDGTQRKLDTFVRYKLQHTNLLSENDQYDLCAVSVHQGTLAGGHYTTLAKNNGTQRWYTFNDSYVAETNQTVITRNAYVLVYLKTG